MSHFLESPRFPGCPSFGFTSEPGYSVQIVQTAGGHERRNQAWSYPRSRITVTVGPRMEDEIQELLEFWHVVGGAAIGFRFKDYTDYKSCRVGETVSVADQPLVSIGGGAYQMVKRYDVGGAFTRDRAIYKPVEGTVTLSGGGSIDYTSGIVTGGGGGTWGGEFDLPCRFASEFPIELVTQRIESVSFVLQELRYEAESDTST